MTSQLTPAPARNNTLRTMFHGALIAILVFISASIPVQAQELSLIRDTEIEKLLHEYGKPVFEYGGIHTDTVRITLIQDDSINAFVTQGTNMFIHTGLLLQSRNSNEVI